MDLRKRLLAESRLYAILDRRTAAGRRLAGIARELADGGVDVVQFRDKTAAPEELFAEALSVRKALEGRKVLTIVNDYPDIARLAGFDGVHLGQDDVPVALARRIVGPERLVGVSCHSLKQALKAQTDGADYIGIGPVFATPTKPDYAPIGMGVLQDVAAVLKIPFFAIGNVNRFNAAQLAATGAHRFAVCRDFIAHKNAARAVRAFSTALNP